LRRLLAADENERRRLTHARFGAYEVIAPLGSGGMGEVYRARDTNLKREVALKALPPALASSVELLARFQREAELLASLNHPNIAQIYGLERSDGTAALAMELVEGPTLENRLWQGRIPEKKRCALRVSSPTRSRPLTSAASCTVISSPRRSDKRPRSASPICCRAAVPCCST